MENNMSVKKRAAIISSVIAVILAASIIGIIYMYKTSKPAKTACIYQNDTLIREIDISDVKEPYTVTIENEDGGRNVIEIRNGSVGVIEASCPDGLCMNMGFIDNSVMPVTCLPNHLVIKISDEEKHELDGVVY
jgi:hypothetical protein